METYEITEQDTYDTLKYGYIPIKHLMDDLKKSDPLFNDYFDGFECLDEVGHPEIYVFRQFIPLLDSDEGFELTCQILNPNNEDRFDAEVWFMIDLYIDEAELRKFPVLDNLHDQYIEIKSRAQFIDVMHNWDVFVGSAFLQIMLYSSEVIDNIDAIVKRDCELDPKMYTLYENTEEYLKKVYLDTFSKIPSVLMKLSTEIILLNSIDLELD